MLLKNKKGFSLIELLVVVAILGVVSPLIFIIFASGIEDFSTTSKYLDEQYTVMEVTRHIRQDVEESKTIIFHKNGPSISNDKVEFKFPGSGVQNKTWEFVTKTYADGETYKQLCLKIGTGSSDVVVDDLDPASMFSFSPITGDINDITRLILVIKPTQLNKKYQGRNVDENINTEFSVRYKLKEDAP